MVILKRPRHPFFGNVLVQNVMVEESTRHKWVSERRSNKGHRNILTSKQLPRLWEETIQCNIHERSPLYNSHLPINTIRSILVISKSKRLSEILRGIRTSTYQICIIAEKINRTATFLKWICNLTPKVRFCLKYCWKEEFLLLDFLVKTRTRFSLWDKRLCEISRVDCN